MSKGELRIWFCLILFGIILIEQRLKSFIQDRYETTLFLTCIYTHDTGKDCSGSENPQ